MKSTAAATIAALPLAAVVALPAPASAATDIDCDTHIPAGIFADADACVRVDYHRQHDGTGENIERIRVYSTTPNEYNDFPALTINFLILRDGFGNRLWRRDDIDLFNDTWFTYPGPLYVPTNSGSVQLCYFAHISNWPDSSGCVTARLS